MSSVSSDVSAKGLSSPERFGAFREPYRASAGDTVWITRETGLADDPSARSWLGVY